MRYIILLFIITNVFAADILKQDFEDPLIFSLGEPFGLSGTGSGTDLGGLWKNGVINGNYTPWTVSGNSSFSYGTKCVEIVRNATYGSGMTVGYRTNIYASDEFQIECSLKITDSVNQFSIDTVPPTGQVGNQVSAAYFGESLQIKDNGAWRSLNKVVPINSWFRIVITGSFSLQRYKIFLDTGSGEVLVGSSSFDSTTFNKLSGVYIAPWVQNYYIYLDDVLIKDKVTLKSAAIDWDSDTYLVWAMKPNAIRNDVPISITDWYLWSNFTYGKSGTRYILNTLAANGVRNIWVRTIGGVAHGYRPQVEGATQWQPNGAQGEDVRNYDFLQDAVEYGHKLGMKVYGWFIPLEEYHGSQNWDRSFITDNRADLWDNVYSSQYVVKKGDCPSFYYSEYRDYKISLINDIIKRYDIDGVVLDFERCSFRNNKWGYLQQIRQAFQNETGIDPWSISTENAEWLAFRARYVGEVVETVRRIINGSARAMDLIAWYPWETPLTAHYDIMKWSQEGLLDTIGVYKHGTEGWGSPGYPTEGLYSSLSSQLNKPVLFGVYTAVTGEANILSCAEAALSQGFNGIVWFEATPLIGKGFQDLPRNLSARSSLVIKSYNIDLTNGGRIFVMSAGSWTLGIDNLQQAIANGNGGVVAEVVLPPISGSHTLIISASLDATCPAGIAAEGYSLNAENQKVFIKTDTNWTNLSSSEPLLRFGQPGIYPFIGE